jgi:ABC-type Mn2+/Zn2+ transport system permease subunit
MLDIFSYPFMQRALLAAFFTGLAAPSSATGSATSP